MSAPTERTLDQLFDLVVVMGGVMNHRLSERGLTPARAEALWLLYRSGPRTLPELGGLLKCALSDVTCLVDALQQAGLVERTADRAAAVQLKESGRSLIADWGADREQGTAQLLGGIPAGDLAVFGSVLELVLDRLRGAYRVG
jgi:DNA-binding MarR family transcriptional regulator